ncbi:MAG: thioesterase family protein [Chlamydiota bacterium]|jgi:acyl-CoA thioesterase FadM
MISRTKISLPDHWHFTTDIQVRVTDLNYGNHLANDKVASLIHEARVRFLQRLGKTEIDLFGLGLIQTDAVIVYKNQAFLGDVLKFEICLSEISKIGITLHYRITKENLEIARAKTCLAFFDYQKQKLVRATPEVDEFFTHLTKIQ